MLPAGVHRGERGAHLAHLFDERGALLLRDRQTAVEQPVLGAAESGAAPALDRLRPRAALPLVARSVAKEKPPRLRRMQRLLQRRTPLAPSQVPRYVLP